MSAPPISAPGIAMRLPVGIDGGVRLSAPIGQPLSIDHVGAPVDAQKIGKPSAFETLFQQTVGKANTSLKHAEATATAFAEGQSDDIHGTMIAASEADIQMRLVGSLRNRVIDAFNEIWRMQV